MAESIHILRSHRTSISIQVTRYGKVIVKAPYLLPKFLIDQFINSKKEWIEKSLHKTSIHKAAKHTYQEGETFLFLGTPHQLTFTSSSEISARNGKLFFPKGAAFRIQKELEAWLKKQAQELITKRIEYHAKKMQAQYKDIFFSDTISKWGTCFHDNTLQFNWRLIMAPLMVIDYVVIHELTHITHKHHQASFWSRVRLFTPAYKQHRKWLEENGKLLQF